MGKLFSENQLLNFKTIFSNRRNELVQSLKIKSSDELDFDGDEVDIIQSNVLQNVNSALSKRDISNLEKLNLALKKLELGEFGSCEECGLAIGEKRLLALPGCTECIKCAEKNEKRNRKF